MFDFCSIATAAANSNAVDVDDVIVNQHSASQPTHLLFRSLNMDTCTQQRIIRWSSRPLAEKDDAATLSAIELESDGRRYAALQHAECALDNGLPKVRVVFVATSNTFEASFFSQLFDGHRARAKLVAVLRARRWADEDLTNDLDVVRPVRRPIRTHFRRKRIDHELDVFVCVSVPLTFVLRHFVFGQLNFAMQRSVRELSSMEKYRNEVTRTRDEPRSHCSRLMMLRSVLENAR